MPAKITSILRRSVVLALSTLILALTCCNKQEKPAQVVQRTFASPDDAAKALVEAAKSDNRNDLLAIFGPESKAVIYSGDPERSKTEFAGFVSDYNVMHRWRKLDTAAKC